MPTSFSYTQLPVIGDSANTAATRILTSFNDVKTFLTSPNITNSMVDVSVLNAAVPIGTIFPYAGGVIPSYWLLCDGSAYSRATYSALYTAIATAYGTGNGSSTFNIPDLRGRFPIGKGSNADISSLGASDGVTESSRTPKLAHSHTVPSHTHSVPAHKHAINSANMTVAVAGTTFLKQGSGAGYTQTSATGAATATGLDGAGHTHTVSGTAGSTGAVDGDAAMTSGGTALTSDSTTPVAPFVTLNFIIKSGVA